MGYERKTIFSVLTYVHTYVVDIKGCKACSVDLGAVVPGEGQVSQTPNATIYQVRYCYCNTKVWGVFSDSEIWYDIVLLRD